MGSLALAFAAPVTAASLAGIDPAERTPPFERTGVVLRAQVAVPPRLDVRDEIEDDPANAGPSGSSKPPRGLEPRT